MPGWQGRSIYADTKKVVAVVDDDQSMLSAAENLLDAHGFTTIKFSSAEEFLGDREAMRADCLLVDIHLEGLSGIELRRQLKVSRPDASSHLHDGA